MSEYRFKKKGLYAHPVTRNPHIEVSEDGQLVDIDDAMATECEKNDWAELATGTPAVSESKAEDVEIIESENKIEKKKIKKKKKSLAERLASDK